MPWLWVGVGSPSTVPFGVVGFDGVDPGDRLSSPEWLLSVFIEGALLFGSQHSSVEPGDFGRLEFERSAPLALLATSRVAGLPRLAATVSSGLAWTGEGPLDPLA